MWRLKIVPPRVNLKLRLINFFKNRVPIYEIKTTMVLAPIYLKEINRIK